MEEVTLALGHLHDIDSLHEAELLIAQLLNILITHLLNSFIQIAAADWACLILYFAEIRSELFLEDIREGYYVNELPIG